MVDKFLYCVCVCVFFLALENTMQNKIPVKLAEVVGVSSNIIIYCSEFPLHFIV